jgi:hypothetical protein
MKKESYVYVWQVIIFGSFKVETRNKRIKMTKWYGFVLMILTIEQTMAS